MLFSHIQTEHKEYKSVNLYVFVSESQYKRQTRVIQSDFTEGHSIYSAIAQQLEGLEIGILGKIKISNDV